MKCGFDSRHFPYNGSLVGIYPKRGLRIDLVEDVNMAYSDLIDIAGFTIFYSFKGVQVGCFSFRVQGDSLKRQ